jgi:RNA polymerase sigma-70 factor (ECF subfamily)
MGRSQRKTELKPAPLDFNRLILENHERIYRLFRRMVSSHDEADDLTQETFIKVFKKMNQFRQTAAFSTWIYRIAVNTGINYLRRQKIRQNLNIEQVEITEKLNEPDDREQKRWLLQRALAKLPPKQQMVVVLRSYQELPFKQIAEIMNSTENAAKVNFAHALKHLREIFIKQGVRYENL